MASWDFCFEIPALPPSLNEIIGSRGKAMKGWRSKAELALLVRNQKNLGNAYPAVGFRLLEITFFFPTRHKRDEDNYLKCLLDALVMEGIIVDDNPECVAYNVVMDYDHDDPRTRICVMER